MRGGERKGREGDWWVCGAVYTEDVEIEIEDRSLCTCCCCSCCYCCIPLGE